MFLCEAAQIDYSIAHTAEGRVDADACLSGYVFEIALAIMT